MAFRSRESDIEEVETIFSLDVAFKTLAVVRG